MHTFCVIPHQARQDPFFDAVFEDGVRVVHQGRLQSLLFSHVLSPAHDLARHIDGPLLEAIRLGQHATLLVTLPAAEEHHHHHHHRGPQSAAGGPNDAASSASVAASPVAPGMEDAVGVAQELYAHFLPLLFRSAERCAVARVRVVTVSAQDRGVYDALQRKRVRNLSEVAPMVVERTGSATRWGTVMQVLSERHGRLIRDGASLAAQTACVVVVDLDGYGSAVLVDVGSDQELLQSLTLILGMRGALGERTYPPYSPLLSLLQEIVSPDSALHVVAIPDPTSEPRTSMRVLRFVAEVEGKLRQDGAVSGEGAAGDSTVHQTSVSGRGPPPTTTATTVRASHGQTGQRGPSLDRRATPRSRSVTQSPERSSRGATPHPPELAAAASAPPPPVLAGTPRRLQSAPPVSATSGAGRTQPLASGPAGQPDHSSSFLNVTGLERQPPPLPSSAASAREQFLTSRIAALESDLRDVTVQRDAAEVARDHAQRHAESMQYALRTKHDQLINLQRSEAKLRTENEEYTRVVPKLLKRLSTMEKQRDDHTVKYSELSRREQEAQSKLKTLQSTVSELRKAVAAYERKETIRLRESLLRSIPSDASNTTFGTAEGKVSGKPRQRTTHEKGGATGAGSENGTASHERVTSIAVEELRRRNTELEGELTRLRTVIARDALSAVNGDVNGSVDSTRGARRRSSSLSGTTTTVPSSALPPPTSACAECQRLHQRLHHYMLELAAVRKEKDQLVQLVNRQRTQGGMSAPYAATPTLVPSEASSDTLPSVNVEAAPPTARLASSSTAHSDVDLPSTLSSAPRSAALAAGVTAPLTQAGGPNTCCAVHRIVSALLAGAASIQTQLDCVAAVLARRVALAAPNEASSASTAQDPLSGLSVHMVREHIQAVSALADSIRDVGSRAWSAGMEEATALPRTATAGDASAITSALTFEMERCTHLRAFVPTFAQLAVATEHMNMRMHTSQPVV